jgi:hypothetical protein
VFNLVQLAVQVIALVEGLIEHSLVCHGMQAECILLNKIWSACVVFWFYPLTTAASFCWATEQYDYMAICLSVLFVSLVAAAYDFRRRRRAERNERMQIAKRVRPNPAPEPTPKVRVRARLRVCTFDIVLEPCTVGCSCCRHLGRPTATIGRPITAGS